MARDDTPDFPLLQAPLPAQSKVNAWIDRLDRHQHSYSKLILEAVVEKENVAGFVTFLAEAANVGPDGKIRLSQFSPVHQKIILDARKALVRRDLLRGSAAVIPGAVFAAVGANGLLSGREAEEEKPKGTSAAGKYLPTMDKILYDKGYNTAELLIGGLLCVEGWEDIDDARMHTTMEQLATAIDGIELHMRVDRLESRLRVVETGGQSAER